MNNFEEQRNKYYLKLQDHVGAISKLVEEGKQLKLVKILLMPKNEKELRFASSYVMFMDDTSKLSKNVIEGKVKEIDLEKSVLVEYLTTIIGLSNEEEIKKVYKTYYDKASLQISYEIVVIGLANSFELIKHICDKCNINIKDESEILQLKTLLELCKKAIAPRIPEEAITEKDINMIETIASKWHELCINNLKEEKDFDNASKTKSIK